MYLRARLATGGVAGWFPRPAGCFEVGHSGGQMQTIMTGLEPYVVVSTASKAGKMTRINAGIAQLADFPAHCWYTLAAAFQSKGGAVRCANIYA